MGGVGSGRKNKIPEHWKRNIRKRSYEKFGLLKTKHVEIYHDKFGGQEVRRKKRGANMFGDRRFRYSKKPLEEDDITGAISTREFINRYGNVLRVNINIPRYNAVEGKESYVTVFVPIYSILRKLGIPYKLYRFIKNGRIKLADIEDNLDVSLVLGISNQKRIRLKNKRDRALGIVRKRKTKKQKEKLLGTVGQDIIKREKNKELIESNRKKSMMDFMNGLT